MRYYTLFLFIILTQASKAQVMLPAYQGVQYKAGIAGCGTLIINHKAVNGVAPVDKTVTYGTVTGIPGDPTKCWITSNLGASRQADSLKDATEASGGWYWQFNLKQGYDTYDNKIAPKWYTGFNNPTTNWGAADDPCTLELGAGWRIPTSTEWNDVNSSGGWVDWNSQWNSGLKLHAAGSISFGSVERGLQSDYWSSTYTGSKGYAYSLRGTGVTVVNDVTVPGASLIASSGTSYQAFPLRCIKNIEE